MSDAARGSSEVPDLGPVPERLSLDAAAVARLVADQFPQGADRSVRPVRNGGWDNLTFHLGDDLLVRLPSAAEYALAVEKEHRWLPVLAGRVPVRIPSPVGLGSPAHGYPFPWSIYRWLPGETVTAHSLTDPIGLAEDLAAFLEALQGVDVADGPRPGIHNWYRGGTLRTYDTTTQAALHDLAGVIDVDTAAAAWTASLDAEWDGVDVWFHGDLAAGNLLVADGRLTAVIDFGTCGVGDPSCDLAVAWTLLGRPGRRVLRERLGVDDATWSRGRGWALWKSLSQLAGAIDDGEVTARDRARDVVERILADFGATR